MFKEGEEEIITALAGMSLMRPASKMLVSLLKVTAKTERKEVHLAIPR